MKKRVKQVTLGEIRKMTEPDEAKVCVELCDERGYHIYPVMGMWERESGGVMLTVGAEQNVAESTETGGSE